MIEVKPPYDDDYIELVRLKGRVDALASILRTSHKFSNKFILDLLGYDATPKSEADTEI